LFAYLLSTSLIAPDRDQRISFSVFQETRGSGVWSRFVIFHIVEVQLDNYVSSPAVGTVSKTIQIHMLTVHAC